MVEISDVDLSCLLIECDNSHGTVCLDPDVIKDLIFTVWSLRNHDRKMAEFANKFCMNHLHRLREDGSEDVDQTEVDAILRWVDGVETDRLRDKIEMVSAIMGRLK